MLTGKCIMCDRTTYGGDNLCIYCNNTPIGQEVIKLKLEILELKCKLEDIGTALQAGDSLSAYSIIAPKSKVNLEQYRAYVNCMEMICSSLSIWKTSSIWYSNFWYKRMMHYLKEWEGMDL